MAGRKSIVQNFEDIARESPDAVAIIVEDGRSFTYAELDALATGISHHVCAMIDKLDIDMGSNDTPLVSVMMPRDIGTVAAILAALKAGAAYVPVDPAFPPHRQSYIFAQSRCHLLIADQECYQKAQALGVALPPTLVVTAATGVVDEGCPAAGDCAASLAAKRADALGRSQGGLAYVLYTSGSTGNPKGVMVPQQGVVNVLDFFAHECAVGPGSHVLGLTTFCFDISVLETFMPLTHGATLVVAFSSTQKDPFRLLDIIAEYNVDVMQATPTTFEMLLATGWRGDPTLSLLVGGEAFRPSLLPMVAASRSVRNVYGPTETTIWSSSYTLPPDLAGRPSAPISVGEPISDTQFYIANEANVAVLMGAGEEGELCIGGVGVVRGYLHAPDLTAVRFLANPYPGGSGFIYRTGDVFRALPGDAGGFVFVRRMDDQVKINGFRIELAEIESVFARDATVGQCVALVRNGRLALYVKPAPHVGHGLGPAELDALRAGAAQSLAYYMMPEALVVVDEFPQTANGKLDRNALPDPPPPPDDPDPPDRFSRTTSVSLVYAWAPRVESQGTQLSVGRAC
jgi:amino acid adenylation domain-containing protein